VDNTLLTVVRYAVFAAFAFAVLVAIASWLVRTRWVSPFGALGKTLRQGTDPLMRPIERRVVRSGGNPIQAGWWLIIGVAIAGVLAVSLAQWVVGAWHRVNGAASGGTRDVMVLVVTFAFDVLYVAIFVRVIGSWLGAFQHARWMRPFYWLTDWLIVPIRRLMPPTGMVDLSPLVALVILWLLKRVVFSVLL